MRRIPATIVTGFLGAGKTSLIRHLLAHADGRRIALVINEFGELGIDREILLGCGVPNCGEDEIIELANGCICCTVAEDFLPTIARLLARAEPPEHIVIETSGLALPKPLVQAFAWPEVKARVTVDGVVAVIDAAAVADGRFADDPAALAAQRAADPALDHDNPLEEVFGDQLACADLVVLNKADLLDARRARRGRKRHARAAAAGGEAAARDRGAVAPDDPARPRRRRRGRSRPAAPRITISTASTTTRISRASSLRAGRSPIPSASSTGSARCSPRTTCCGSRAFSTCPARSSARWCRASARASSIISTGRGASTRRAGRISSSSAAKASTAPR